MEDRWLAARRLGWQSAALVAVLAVYHVALAWLMRNTGLRLGSVGPGTKVYRVVPLYMYFAPHVKTGLLPAIGALAAYGIWLRAWVSNPKRLAARGFVAAAMAWHCGLAVAVAMIDGGPDRLWRPYVLLHDSDYLGAVDQVRSVRQFLQDYVVLLPRLPLHCHTHPPGGVIFLWWVGRLIHPGAPAAALATIAASSLSVPAVYWLAGAVLEQGRARLAAGLFLVVPSVMLYTATSMDAVFLVPLIWSVVLLWQARSHRPWLLGALAGLSASLAALATFSAAFLVVWAAAMLAVTAIADRARLGAALRALAAAAAVSVTLLAALGCWCGYDLFENLRAAVGYDRAMMSGGDPAASRPHLHLIAANLAAFFAGAGIPLAVLFARQAWRDLRPGEEPFAARRLNLTFLLALAVTVALPLYTLEVERIWLFMVPLVVIGAVRQFGPLTGDGRAGPEIGLSYGLLAFQVVLMETLLETTW